MLHEDLVWLLESSILCEGAGFLKAATLQGALLFTSTKQPCVL